MPEDSPEFIAETLPSSSELTVLGSDVSIDNPFRLLLSGNEADGETMLDSSHLADSKNRKVDSNIQEVAEILLRSSEPQVLENRGTLHGSPDLNQEDLETLQRSSRLMKEEDDETLQGSLVSNISENEFEMGPNMEDEDYLDIVATPELDEKDLYTRKRSARNNRIVQKFKKLRAKARKIIGTNQKTSWANYIASITPQTSNTEVWRKIRKTSGKNSPRTFPVLKFDNKTLTNDSDDANALASQFQNNSSSDNYKPTFQRIKQATERHIDFEPSEDTIQSYNEPFSIEKLDRALQETQSSVPDPDDIVYDIIKKMPSVEKG
ncbi:hypothetical protein JTB14_025489 [Gonioctena quinquepunctata]|nr:hypothetical protein JTB14_025489 [Gonioctena quinquepunctata]